MIRRDGTFTDTTKRGATVPGFARLRTASAALLLGVLAFTTLAGGTAKAEERALKLYNNHTKERAVIVFKRNGKYDRAGLARMNQFLRDWRRNEPTKMDPMLLDLIWEAYRETGSDNYIHVVSSYRSPATNSSLRKRSKGVAKNSQHTHGKAMDFFIPGVPLAKLRAIGLRLQVGGVGYYPTSGSPFVHFDTGSVRHWPRMTRQQLVKVFPKGRTLHIPSDGKPLPGYAQALAAYKMRGKSGQLAAALDRTPRNSGENVGEPIIVASVVEEAEDEEFDAGSAEDTVVMAKTDEPPVPRFSPVPVHQLTMPTVVASADPALTVPTPPADVPMAITAPTEIPLAAAALPPYPVVERAAKPFEFDSPSHWTSTPVPTALAQAMAKRDVSPPASLPIEPTAVVATVEVSRPLRAETMTTAVLQGEDSQGIRNVTPVFAYAAPMEVTNLPAATAPVAPVQKASAVVVDGIPFPVANPLHAAAMPVRAEPSPVKIEPPAQITHNDLTLTGLDTVGLRLWMGSQSTRQKRYALMTMPDFNQIPTLFAKPELSYSAGFGDLGRQDLRTDRFSGPLVQPPRMVDLTGAGRLAFR